MIPRTTSDNNYPILPVLFQPNLPSRDIEIHHLLVYVESSPFRIDNACFNDAISSLRPFARSSAD